jgi:hypothetical protein
LIGLGRRQGKTGKCVLISEEESRFFGEGGSKELDTWIKRKEITFFIPVTFWVF